ncbi:hypothetical protein HFP72_31645 [Nocardiopsis sp. ARC36]
MTWGDNSGGSKWRLARVQGGHGVLVGAAREGDERIDLEGYAPYAGPDRLPRTWFTASENDREQGSAYWRDGVPGTVPTTPTPSTTD